MVLHRFFDLKDKRLLYLADDAAEVFGITVAVRQDKASGVQVDICTVFLSGTILDGLQFSILIEDL